jgi:hypothetical protein
VATTRRRQRARKGTGSIAPRGRRFVARVDLGLGADGKRIRRTRSFDTRREAQVWIEQQRSDSDELILPVADQRLDEYLRWWLEHEAAEGKPGRAPLAATTLQGYRINVERHLIPALGQKRLRSAHRQRPRRVREPQARRGLRPLDGQQDERDAPVRCRAVTGPVVSSTSCSTARRRCAQETAARREQELADGHAPASHAGTVA